MNAKAKTAQIIVREWNRWTFSPEGKNAIDLRTLPRSSGTFLENRLYLAYMAGVKAAETAERESQSQIET